MAWNILETWAFIKIKEVLRMKNCFLVFTYVYMYVFAYGGHTTAVQVEARRWTPPRVGN